MNPRRSVRAGHINNHVYRRAKQIFEENSVPGATMRKFLVYTVTRFAFPRAPRARLCLTSVALAFSN